MKYWIVNGALVATSTPQSAIRIYWNHYDFNLGIGGEKHIAIKRITKKEYCSKGGII